MMISFNRESFSIQMITSGAAFRRFRQAAIVFLIGAMVTLPGCSGSPPPVTQQRKDAIKQFLTYQKGKAGSATPASPQAKKKWPGVGNIKERVLKDR
jgi:hypothetical protein